MEYNRQVAVGGALAAEAAKAKNETAEQRDMAFATVTINEKDGSGQQRANNVSLAAGHLLFLADVICRAVQHSPSCLLSVTNCSYHVQLAYLAASSVLWAVSVHALTGVDLARSQCRGMNGGNATIAKLCRTSTTVHDQQLLHCAAIQPAVLIHRWKI